MARKAGNRRAARKTGKSAGDVNREILTEHSRELAESLVKAVEDGTAPWVQAWEPGVRILPYNVDTGNTYRGSNSVHLANQASMRGFEDERWGTYRQIQKMGGHVRRGERGTSVLFWKMHRRQVVRNEQGRPVLDDSGKKVHESVRLRSPWVRKYTVFNAEQATGLPKRPDRAPGGHQWDAHKAAEEVLRKSGATLRHNGHNRASYDLPLDRITLPFKHQYPEAAGYYQTALHELGHWTGHPSRLNRKTLIEGLRHGVQSTQYAREELRAEISSMMVGDRLRLGHDPKRSENYVGQWITRLRMEPIEIYRACRDAQAMSDHILGRTIGREQTGLEAVRGQARQQAPARPKVFSIPQAPPRMRPRSFTVGR